MKGHIFFCLASEHPNAMREKRGVKKKPDCCQIIENHHTQARPMEASPLIESGDMVI
jgi:hypothetical protein